MKKILIMLLIGLAVLATVLVVNTLRTTSKQITVKASPPLELDVNAVLAHFSDALKFRTISFNEDTAPDATEFNGFIAHLEKSYPRMHKILARELINDYSLLFTWRGKDPQLSPLILLAHYDVVPVTPETESEWTEPPFAGRQSGGYMYGRGALDDKGCVIGLCETVELLLAQDFTPQRTIYLAFGHDEELGGNRGAAVMSAMLKERGVHAALVLDEGGVIGEGLLQGVSGPVALVGLAEKGYISLKLELSDTGGHSSMPPPHTAIGSLALAVTRLEAQQLPMRFEGAAVQLFDTIAPEMDFTPRFFLTNRWLFAPLLRWQFSKDKRASALFRTTTAVTMFQSGTKDNVLPQRALAVVNFRILPGETVDDVLAHARRTIDNPAITVSQLHGAWNPSPVSDTNGLGYKMVKECILSVFPDVTVAPNLVLGATDSRYYAPISDCTLRFMPWHATPDELSGFHGTNERIRISDLVDFIRFYRALLSYQQEV